MEENGSRLVWRHRTALLLIALLAVVAPGAPALGQTESRYLEEAREHVSQKQFDQAIPLLQTELKQNPDNDDARELLARVYSWQHHFDESIAEYEHLLQKTPENTALRADYARVLAWSGRHEASIREYRRVLKADPTNTETRLGYTRALAWSGDLAGASMEYERILAQDPKMGDAWLGRASVARWRGAPTASDRFLTSAVATGADSEGVDDERGSVWTAISPGLGGGWYASKERQYVSGPDFTIDTEGPYITGKLTASRAVGLTGRVDWLKLTETPTSGGVPNYDLNSVDTRVGATFLRGYPWQASVGAEYQTFETRGDTALYPLIGDDTFFGWNARLWRFTGRMTPSFGFSRNYLAMKDTLSSGLLVFDPGHVDDYEGALGYQWNSRFTSDLLASRGVYSDDNRRFTAAGGAAYKARTGLPTITFDGRLTFQDWDFASPNYFTPLNSVRGAAGVTFAGYTERPSLDYSFRYEFSGTGSSNFDDIWVHAWSGNFNVVLDDRFPVGVEAAYSIDNNNYEAWYVAFSGSVRW
ncbi:MAG: tetratricopeptide repeat protein [Candidatus Eiseniibacteriota bacterium]